MIDFGEILLFLDLLFYLGIFVGTFYVAMHSRTINQSIITLLWYVGLASFFNALTIIFQYIFGENFPFAYSHIGIFTQTLLNAMIATTVGTIFLLTIKSDFKAREFRKKRGRKRN